MLSNKELEDKINWLEGELIKEKKLNAHQQKLLLRLICTGSIAIAVLFASDRLQTTLQGQAVDRTIELVEKLLVVSSLGATAYGSLVGEQNAKKH